MPLAVKLAMRTDSNESDYIGAFVVENGSIIAGYIDTAVSDIFTTQWMVSKKRMGRFI